MIKMMSIDSSTKSTGISIWIDGKLNNTLCFELDDKDMESRLIKMIINLYDLLDIEKPDMIWIEEAVVNRNQQTQRFLVRLQGAIQGWCIRNNCDFNTIRPTQWRKYCPCEFKGKRDELKKQSIQYVKEKYDIECNDDIADSICIGEAIFVMWD